MGKHLPPLGYFDEFQWVFRQQPKMLLYANTLYSYQKKNEHKILKFGFIICSMSTARRANISMEFALWETWNRISSLHTYIYIYIHVIERSWTIARQKENAEAHRQRNEFFRHVQCRFWLTNSATFCDILHSFAHVRQHCSLNWHSLFAWFHLGLCKRNQHTFSL